MSLIKKTMAKYVLGKVERKTTSTGKKMIKAELLNEDGNTAVEEDVAIWDSFPNFATLREGDRVEGTIDTKVNGQFTNKTLKAPYIAKSGVSGGFKAGMKEMVKEKQEGIKVAQENKELGIKTSSTIRMATDVVIATLANEKIIDESVIKGKIREWREWFLAEWDNIDNAPPFN